MSLKQQSNIVDEVEERVNHVEQNLENTILTTKKEKGHSKE